MAEPIRARLRRLPLLRGLEPNANALATSQDFQFTGIFHNNHGDSLELFCHDSFIYTPKEPKNPADEAAGTSQMSQGSILHFP